MPALLKPASRIEIPQTTIDAFKVAAHKVEDNVERWLEIWVIFGNIVDGDFVEYFDPATGMPVPPLSIKLEDGAHPLSSGSALLKCPTCDRWYGVGDLPPEDGKCADDGADLVPYDGFTRAGLWGMTDPTYYSDQPGICPYFVTKKALYEFLAAEVVPDPVTWLERPLVDVESWS